ncbi:nuclear transport factor 2 family protein [Bauldia sp.]|uniref:nuclear transport factor 2 family protein n=1 Tax=Bauldia sp. TaxID=2575872 RepID=UPI003BAD432F
MTADARAILMQMFSAFNQRDLEGTLEHFAPDVAWRDEATHERRTGRLELGAYWEKAWKETDLRIAPMTIDVGAGKTRARVQELAKAADGTVLVNRKLDYVFTFEGVFIASMFADQTTIETDDQDDDNGDDE